MIIGMFDQCGSVQSPWISVINSHTAEQKQKHDTTDFWTKKYARRCVTEVIVLNCLP